DVGPEAARLQAAHVPRRAQRELDRRAVETLVQELRDVPAIRDLAHEAALATDLDVALWAQHPLEHESQRLREARARPPESRLHELPAGPGRRRGGDPPPAQEHEPAGERDESDATAVSRQRPG